MNQPPTIQQKKQPKIYVAGHRGMVGAAIVRALERRGISHIVVRTHAELDLVDQRAVREFFRTEKPDQVYMGAAKVGGIHATRFQPSSFIRTSWSRPI
jgi:GDP-L-fucose synthase